MIEPLVTFECADGGGGRRAIRSIRAYIQWLNTHDRRIVTVHGRWFIICYLRVRTTHKTTKALDNYHDVDLLIASRMEETDGIVVVSWVCCITVRSAICHIRFIVGGHEWRKNNANNCPGTPRQLKINNNVELAHWVSTVAHCYLLATSHRLSTEYSRLSHNKCLDINNNSSHGNTHSSCLRIGMHECGGLMCDIWSVIDYFLVMYSNRQSLSSKSHGTRHIFILTIDCRFTFQRRLVPSQF